MRLAVFVKAPDNLRIRAGAALAAALLLYCAWHAISGRYGLWSYLELQERRAALDAERAGLRQGNARLARDVALLRARRLDPDLLGELARRDLHLAHPNDLIIRLAPAKTP